MMLNEKVAQLLNAQINKEFYSAYTLSRFCKLLHRTWAGWICQLVSSTGTGRAGPRPTLHPVPSQ